MRTRFLGLLAAILLVVAACGETAPSPASTPSVTPAPTPTAAVTATPAPSPSAAPLSPTPSPTPLPSASLTGPSTAPDAIGAASLPVRADAAAIGVALAPAPGGRLFVAVPAEQGTVLALLDARGKVRRGWPVLLKGTSGCELDADPSDGSIRAVCGGRAYALDTAGRLMPGWPVELPVGGVPWGEGNAARIVNGDLYMILTASPEEGPTATLVRVARDGALSEGATLHNQDLVGCCAAIGPDGTAYLISYVGGGQLGNAWETMLSALTLDGLQRGYPLRIDGSASVPAFGPDGRIYVAVDRADYTVETGSDSSSQVVAIEADGRTVDGWPVELPIDTGFGGSEGIGAPLIPVVAPDGYVTVVSGHSGGTVAYTIDPTGKVRAGWPFRSGSRLVAHSIGVGGCPSGCGMCGLPLASSSPRAGRDGTLYIVQGTRGDDYTGGNRITAVGTDGEVAAGWPVTLTEKDAWFPTFAVGDGVVFGYALEPAGMVRNKVFGTCTVFSGTVAALDARGDPVYTTTLVAP